MNTNEKVKKVSITIVGDNSASDFTFAGVVNVPEDMPLEEIVSLYRDYLKGDREEEFTDWLVATKGFTEVEDVGYVFILPENYSHVFEKE